MINTTKLIFSSFFLTCYGLRLGPGNCVDHGQGCQGDFWFRQILSFHTTRSTVNTKSIYLIHISQNDICCFTCFRKYRKTLRAEHMNVSLVTQHGTISGKVSLYLYLLTSWFLSRTVIYLIYGFIDTQMRIFTLKVSTQQLQDGSTPQRWRNTTGNRCRWKNTTASPLRCSLAS